MKKKNEVLVALGFQIRKLRTEQNLSQEELADYASLDRTYLGGIERGERNVSVMNLAKIAKALNLHISLLFDLITMEMIKKIKMKEN